MYDDELDGLEAAAKSLAPDDGRRIAALNALSDARHGLDIIERAITKAKQALAWQESPTRMLGGTTVIRGTR
jgi:hypothetical protein